MAISRTRKKALEEIKERRKRLGLKQPEMDVKLFYAKGNYTKMERGELNITLDKLEAIAKALGWEVRISFYEFQNKL